MDFAFHKDIPQLQKIWSICFSDPQDYIEFYFEHCFSYIKIPVIRNQTGDVVSMLSLIPTILKIGNRQLNASYIYAVATLPEQRSKGLAGKLLDQACMYCKGEKQSIALLVPQSSSLHAYYKRHDFEIPTTLYHTTLVNKGSNDVKQFNITPCSKADFVSLRSQYQIQKNNVLLHDKNMLQYIYDEIYFVKGYILKIQADNQLYYAILYKKKNGVLYIKETSLDKTVHAALPSILHYFNANKAIIRYDIPFENAEPFHHTRIRLLDNQLVLPDTIYVNLMLD